jgi:hypothetical protein
MEEKRNAFKVMAGNSEGKMPFGRPRHIGFRIIVKWVLMK